MIIGGVMPGDSPLSLGTYNALKSDYFLERREMGIINIGGEGQVTIGTDRYILNKLDCL